MPSLQWSEPKSVSKLCEIDGKFSFNGRRKAWESQKNRCLERIFRGIFAKKKTNKQQESRESSSFRRGSATSGGRRNRKARTGIPGILWRIPGIPLFKKKKKSPKSIRSTRGNAKKKTKEASRRNELQNLLAPPQIWQLFYGFFVVPRWSRLHFFVIFFFSMAFFFWGSGGS